MQLSLPLAVLLIYAGVHGLFLPGFYRAETLNWQAQCIGQDAIDLFLIAPVLIFTSILARQNKTAFLLSSGVNVYLIYTF